MVTPICGVPPRIPPECPDSVCSPALFTDTRYVRSSLRSLMNTSQYILSVGFGCESFGTRSGVAPENATKRPPGVMSMEYQKQGAPGTPASRSCVETETNSTLWFVRL